MNTRPFFLCFFLFNVTVPIVCSTAHGGAGSSNDTGQCRHNLSVVFAAIQEYRRAHHRLPERLADLVPVHLPRPDLLTCPAARVGATAFLFEFAPMPLTNDLAQGVVTLRSLRQWQMGRIGSEMPMVRCTNHSPVLNLSFGGAIYESTLDWEDHFSALVQKQDLSLEKLLPEHLKLEVIRIPAREPGTPGELLDLAGQYNVSLKPWIEGGLEESLPRLPAGQIKVGGWPFDVRGVIQLGSRDNPMSHRPAAVSNIIVGLRCQSLVFLHGTVREEVIGNVIGSYVIHFEDGSTTTFPIRYGRPVLDWQADPAGNRNFGNTNSIWMVSSGEESSRRKAVRVYATEWSNPDPRLRIEQIDFVSSMAFSAPFLVAVTAVSEQPKNLKNGESQP